MSQTDVSWPTKTAEPIYPREVPFEEIRTLLKEHFYKADEQAIRIVLGAIKSHHLDIGDPAWLFVVAPPGCGKTTISIAGAADLPEVMQLSDFTENTFLSGFYKHPRAGLLEKLGGHMNQDGDTYIVSSTGILLAKDFTTVLSMNRDKRGAILAQLREIHDGSFKRDFGTGESKNWNGRVTIIAAVTPDLDRHYAMFNVLGERFLQVRWHRPDSDEAGEWAIRQQGMEEQIRNGFRQAIGNLFKASLTKPPRLPAEMASRISKLAEIIAVGRTHVSRYSSGNREIEHVPEPEANTRLSKGLAALARGIAALNRHEIVQEQDLQDVVRVGLDCLTDLRRQVLLSAFMYGDLLHVKGARTTINRTVEELEALGILEEGTGKPAERFAKLWESVGVFIT